MHCLHNINIQKNDFEIFNFKSTIHTSLVIHTMGVFFNGLLAELLPTMDLHSFSTVPQGLVGRG